MKASAHRTIGSPALVAPRSTYSGDDPLFRRRRGSRCGLLFLDPLSIEGAGHRLVPFVTGVLVDLVLRLLHEQHGRPGLRVSLGIVDGHFVPERIGVAACESLGQTPARAQSGPPVGGVSAEIGGFNDQRVTFPTAARVTKPLRSCRRQPEPARR